MLFVDVVPVPESGAEEFTPRKVTEKAGSSSESLDAQQLRVGVDSTASPTAHTVVSLTTSHNADANSAENEMQDDELMAPAPPSGGEPNRSRSALSTEAEKGKERLECSTFSSANSGSSAHKNVLVNSSPVPINLLHSPFAREHDFSRSKSSSNHSGTEPQPPSSADNQLPAHEAQALDDLALTIPADVQLVSRAKADTLL